MDRGSTCAVSVLKVYALVWVLLCPVWVEGQDPQQRPDPEPDVPFHVQVDAAVYRVRVIDGEGKLLRGLKAQDFQVSDRGEPRPIIYFSEEKSAPVSVALFIDVGSAMKEETISRAKETVFDLIHALDREDEILIGTFADEVEVLTELTRERLRLVQGLENLSPKTTGSRVAVKSAPTEVPHGVAIQLALSGGNSETGWAADDAIQALKQAAHYQKAILVFSAGSPGLSESTLEHLREAEIHFFVAPVPNRLGNLLSLGTTGSMQNKSVQETGGLQFPLWQTLEQIDAIRTALKSYYLIGFEPAEHKSVDEEKVRIQVTGDRKCHVASLPVLLDRSRKRR